MNAINWKKLLLPNIPYLLFVYLFDKVGQAVRLAPGADLSGKVLSLAKKVFIFYALISLYEEKAILPNLYKRKTL